MDGDGLIPEALREALARNRADGRRVKMIYTIPNFHNPAGITQPQARREEILSIAKSAGVLVLEDDPYGLLGFDGHVPQAIRAMDSDAVVYLGSFSKTVAGGLRVGWAVAPHGVREKIVLAAEAATLCPSNFSQLTVSEYLRTQPWMDQVKAFRELYMERRDALLTAMSQLFPHGTTWTVPTGGFYSWVTLPEGMDATAMLPRAVAALVAYVPGTGFFVDGQGRDCMRLSYCYPTPERITEGVRRISGVMEAELELINTFGSTASHLPPGPATPGPDLA
jgi:DNA-binding transcriptional MocR family regulator